MADGAVYAVRGCRGLFRYADGVGISGEYADETPLSSAYCAKIRPMSAHDEVTTISEAGDAGSSPGTRPFNDLPLLPPKADVETVRTLKKAIAANKALAELRIAGNLVPNQELLIRAIVLQEAKLSSEIENIVTTNDELYRAFNDDAERTDPATKEVLRYQDALWHGYQHLKSGNVLSAGLFTRIVSIIKERDMDVRRMPGTRIVNRKAGEPIYSPPEGEALIRRLLDNLSEYLYREDEVVPLIKMAVAHYQFEAIHPFPDGNGRTGRVLNILYLVDRGLLEVPVLYLSRYIIQNKSEYYAGLRKVTEEGAWEEWVIYILDAIESTARETQVTIERIRDAMLAAIDDARLKMNKGYSRELIELIFLQPYTRISDLETAGIAKRDTASEYLRELERIGLLQSIKLGRQRLFVNRSLLAVLSR